MRADRLLRLVLLLQTRGRMTADELGAALEVSVRTIYRDIEALSGAGFPVYTERGAGGGCQLVDGYRTTLTGLSASEAQALAFAAMPGAAAELGVGALAAAAHLKVLTAVSPRARDTIATVQRCFHLDPRGWFRTAQPQHPHLPELATAVWEARQVSSIYRRAQGTARPRVLGPLGLVLKDGLWYLAARAPDEVKTFRVSRFEAVTVMDEAVERPPDFDLETWWEQWSDEFETGLNRYPVTVRVSPVAVSRLRDLVSTAHPPIVEHDGWYRLVLALEREEFAESMLLRFGANVEVVDPPELRHRLEVTTATLFGLYHGSRSDDTVSARR